MEVRKIELIVYGYGIREILELDVMDFETWVEPRSIPKCLEVDSPPSYTRFKIEGTIGKVKLITRKYLRKWKNGSK